MNKTFTKVLSVLLAVMMLLTAAPAIVMAAEDTAGTPTAPVFSLELVSDSDESTIVSLKLKENSFKCLGLTITACENLKLTKIETNIDIFVTGGIASSNTENGMISIARTDAFEAEYDIATYTFEKETADSICAEDFEITVTDCGVEFEGTDVDVAESVVVENNVPDTHVHKNTTEDRKEATCTEDGYVKVICDCGETVSETVLPATNHKNTTEDSKEATCTEDGYVKVICVDCGITVSETAIPATNHKNTKEEHKDATCTEDGYDKVICKDCGITVSETAIPATNHKNTKEEHKDATCTEDGYHKVICIDCGQVIDQTVIPAAGHGETKKENLVPTCTENGYIRSICTVCNEVTEEIVLDSNGHNHIQDIKVATCTEDGYIRQYCPACGDVKPGAVTLYSTGHRWSAWSIIEQPTHSKEGVERRICSVCGIDEERSVPKLVTKPSELVMSMQEIGMNFRQTTRLFVNILPEEAAYSTEIIWESSDESVATVDETGSVYATGVGTATITARTVDGELAATCEVTVSYSIIQWIIVYILFGWIWYL